MTRILVLSDLWPPFPGGAERLAFNVARHLQRRGHGVAVLTGYENADLFDGPPVVVAPIAVGADRADGWAVIADRIAHDEPAVIVTHHLYANTFAGELADCGIPVVQLVLNGPRLESAAFAVFISEWVRHQAGNARATDLTMWPPAYPDIAADSHGDAIGFVKPYPHKGVELVGAIAMRMPERRFVVLRGEWQTLENVRPFRKARNVEFVEPVADMRDFYRRVRLMLVPSRSEDAGTVAQEATVNRIPVICSRVGGLAETGAGGVLLEPDDVAGWVATIEALDDPVAYQRVVERQVVHLSAHDHPRRLATLTARIEELAR